MPASVSPEEYSKNKGTGVYYDFNEDGSDYLTNSELLDIRERYVPGNTNLINNVGSAKGLSTITKEIRDIIKEFGNESPVNAVRVKIRFSNFVISNAIITPLIVSDKVVSSMEINTPILSRVKIPGKHKYNTIGYKK